MSRKMINSTNPATRIAYNFNQINESETEIEIYDVIASEKSYDWWTGTEGSEVTPADFKEQLNAITTPNITIRMNSGGGEVFAANAIAVAIEEAVNAGKNIVCKIDGICASAAVQIATACKQVIIHKSALMMIHNPMSLLWGYYDANELGKVMNMLTATKDSIINSYEEKTGMSRQKLSNMMDAETWLDGNEAVEKGFADKLMFDDDTGKEGVLNRIKTAVVNTAFNIPETYRTALNQIQPKETNKEGEPENMEIKTVQDLKAQLPDLVNELTEEIKNEVIVGAREEGVKAERERIKAIDAMQGKVQAEVLDKAKYETFDTAEKVALDAITNDTFIKTGVLDAMKGETAAANEVKGLGNTGEATPPVDEKKVVTDNAAKIAEEHLKKLGKVEK